VIARLVAALVLLGPGSAWACATCIASAYGDRTFNWAFLGLILMPFAVGLGIAGVLYSHYRALHSESTSGSSRGAAAGAAQVIHEESSP
jgi:hypothetical protein